MRDNDDMTFTDLLICPLCGEKLGFAEGSSSVLRCPGGHSYDVSRAGYVNLLPPGKGRNAKTGDERDMIRARSAFLRRGCYDPIDRAAAELLGDALSTGDPVRGLILCDMGAGEGTHTVRISGLLHEKTGETVLSLGFDASKHGAESGCRYARSVGCFDDGGDGPIRVVCLPANLFHLPVRDGCADAALSLFAPIAWEETARILTSGGLFLAVSSGREHLLELRRILYDEVRFTEFHPEPPEGSPFVSLDRTTVSFSVELETPEQIRELFTMTPFFHRVPSSGRERLERTERLTVTAQAELSLWRKTSPEDG